MAQLEARGISGKILGNNLMVSCPWHNDTNPSLGVHIHKGVFNCQSGACGERGNFTKLIAELDNVTYEEAEIALRSQMSIKEAVREVRELLSFDQVLVQKSLSIKKFHKMFPPIKGTSCEDYVLNDRHIDLETSRSFDLRAGKSIKLKGIRWNSRWNNRVLIPIYDHNNKLMTFTGRSIEKNPYRKTVKHTAKKQLVLFGLNVLLRSHKELPFLVIVEGEFDAIYLQSLGIPAVATMGTSGLTPAQISLLMKCTEVVFICFDGDKAGRVSAKKELKKLDFMTTYNIKLPKDKDPNKLSKKAVRKYIRTPIQDFMHARHLAEECRRLERNTY